MDIEFEKVSEELKNKSLEILDILPDNPNEALTVMCYLLGIMIKSIDGADFNTIVAAIKGNMKQ